MRSLARVSSYLCPSVPICGECRLFSVSLYLCVDLRPMHIRDRQIGPDHPPYVIAEIGVNHDGSVDRAIELTDAAADADADAVKLQLFRTDLLMSKAAKLAAYQKAAGETDPLAMLRRLELSIEQMAPVVERAHARGIHAIVTVFSVALVAEAETLPWDAYKSASPDLVNKPLLDAMAATGKPMIVSTGASTMEEVQRTAAWLGDARDRLALLHCVSSYPAPDTALGGIGALAAALDQPVGYSDHSPEVDTGYEAVGLGACLLEKHVTYDRLATGPDHASSCVVYGELARYIECARQGVELRRAVRAVQADDAGFRVSVPARPGEIGVAEMLDAWRLSEIPRTKAVLDCERDVRLVSRQSLTTTRALPAGHTLTADDLTIKRPGTGIAPWRVEEAVGRRLARAVEADMPLVREDIANLK